MNTMNRLVGGPVGLVLSAALLVSVAGAASAAEPTKNDGGQKVNLGGPKVEQTGTPENGQKGEKGDKADKADRGEQAEHPRLVEYMAAVRSLRQAKDASMALSAEQRETIGEVVRTHRAEMAKFMEAHKDEIAELRAQSGIPDREEMEERRGGRRGADRPQVENEMGQPGEEGDDARPMDDGTQGNEGQRARPQPPTPEQQDARDRLRELMQQGPDEGAVVRTIEGVLTPVQVKAVREAIETNREQRRNGEGAAQRRQRGPAQSDRVRQERPAGRGEKKDEKKDKVSDD